MRTFTDGTLTVRAFDRDVWKQERNLLRVSDTDSARVMLETWDGAQWVQTASYTLDENHEVEIDLSDYLRVHPTGRFYISNVAGDSVNFDYVVVGLIDPSSVIIPDHAMKIGALFGFPSMMMRAINGVQTKFEIRGLADSSAGWEGLLESGLLTSGALANGSNAMTGGVVSFSYGDRSGIELFFFKPIECGRRYASVRWISYTGAERCHTWEVVKSKSETAGAYEVLMQDGSFNVVKGRTDGFAIRLDGLNAYDVWYYADVCHSSRVEVSFDGEKWQQVDVITKGVTTPDGTAGKLGTLEVELKYKEYDAVAL